MAGFRGFGDDAMKVAQDQRQHAAQMAQIAASERASQRAASVSLSGQRENARQANMADARAGDQLAASEEARGTETALKIADMGQKERAMRADTASRQESIDLGYEQLGAQERARTDQLEVQLAETAQKERQLQLNEATYARLDAEYQKEQAAQAELQSADVATQLAVIRAAAASTGPLGISYLNALNNLRGVAYGDPGSTTQVFPVIDPQTGARLGIGTVKIGKDGKPVQSILDPHTIIPKVLASMSPDKAEEYVQTLIGNNTARGSDRMTAAALKWKQQNALEFAKTDPATLLKNLSEQESDLSMAPPSKAGAGKAKDPANQENLDRTRTIKTNVLKTMEEMTGGEAGANAPKLSPEQQAAQAGFTTPPGGAGAKPGPAAAVKTGKDKAGHTATAKVEGKMLTITIDGKPKEYQDTPKNRETLKLRFGITL